MTDSGSMSAAGAWEQRPGGRAAGAEKLEARDRFGVHE